MTEEQRLAAMSLLRTTLAALGGFAVGHGYVSEATATEIGGAVVILAPAVWGYFNAMRQKKAPAP